MPAPLIAKGAIVAASLAVAAAVAIYESPEVRRYADDTRRRVAIALQSLSDEINPNGPSRRNETPLFNRPEDAEGFAMTSLGVDVDEETRRRQREELMYWNAIRMSKEEEQEASRQIKREDEAAAAAAAGPSPPATTFDSILGAQAVASGTDAAATAEGMRSRNVQRYANPFNDEYEVYPETASPATVRDDESDIYSATTVDRDYDAISDRLISVGEDEMVDGETGGDYMETLHRMQELRDAALSIDYASDAVDEWGPNLVSPPAAAEQDGVSSLSSDDEGPASTGQLTPTDSVSIIGTEGEDSDDVRDADVVSEDDSIMTPTSWSDVDSDVDVPEVHH